MSASRKRSASQLNVKAHLAKVAAAEPHIAEGRPPSGLSNLAAEISALTPLDMFKHELEWYRAIDDLRAACTRLRHTVSVAAVARALITEQHAYGIPTTQRLDAIDSSARLIYFGDDADPFYHPDVPNYGDVCACCDRMKESWDNAPRRYADSDPRWRVIGTVHFVCHMCRARLRAGDSLPIVNRETAARGRRSA